MVDKLKRQMGFIMEVDKLKEIFRQSIVSSGARYENDAEHSWHISLMAILLSEHANERVDVLRVVKMLLIHDIVEIDAGDTYNYDEEALLDKRQREEAAAERLFGLLPDEQRDEFMELWEEFEEKKTPEARYAAALDRLQPMLLNYMTQGKSWIDHGITSDMVFRKNRHIEDGSEALWDFAEEMLNDCIDRGYLKK